MLGAAPKLKAQSLTTDCYRILKDAILRLEILPGTPLVEAQLAGQLGISKTPIRETLARLAGEGLVVAEAGRGSFVAGLSEQTIRELYQLRIILESASLREVAPGLTDADLVHLVELDRAAGEARTRDDEGGFVESIEDFHLFLVHKSTNRTLIAIIDGIFEQVRRVRIALYQAHAPQRIAQPGVVTHQQIIEALMDHDGQRAAELIATDIGKFLARLTTAEVQAALTRLAYPR